MMARLIPRVRTSFSAALVLVLALPVSARSSNAKDRIHLVPQFSAGQVFRYNIQLRMETTSRSTGPVIDPEGATVFDQSVNVVLRLAVLSVAGATGGPGPVRLRATYEKVAASSKSDSYDPDAAAKERDYQKLEGRSMEFTLHPDGKITDIKGLEDVATDPSRAVAVNQWLNQLTLGASLPQKGIAVGKKWSSKQPLESAPLTGVIWQTESTYQRDEPCPVLELQANTDSGGKKPIAPAREECAILLTRSKTRDSQGGRDRTPSVYRENGLRTSGEWKGTGETLSAISLRTGMVVSVTQSSTTHMDFTVTAVASGNHIHYAGDTHSESQITLVSRPAAP
jgi:hypothetical protein